ncbi:hypothetical protein [Segniliparus rugosus]|uniref:Uncharacterized protein n=1 Tax=Segniliparus rugosus (strain ATCC BAA-974 / DSM 45345 / CCUG 50838 / CIP 108380 / JCM 13579 / CDC 945) TaxID=679197 RepID=E5XT23_SEGRC|nr:hypothetical protein [Segniliparus rugosus]EFV12494.2 hypothetical protein HMPREF9336_02645 [Segniliparus rugosus ATCC BAA-974]
MISVSKKTAVAALALGAAALLGFSPAAAKTIGDPQSFEVTYQVDGSQGANIARIRYQTSNGQAVAESVSLPWSYSFRVNGLSDGYNVPAGQLGVYVDRPSGSSVDPMGIYACKIWVNGQVMEARSQDAAHVAICFPHDD